MASKNKHKLKRELATIEDKIKNIMGSEYLVCNKCGNVIICRKKEVKKHE